jgi:uncharacterized protein (TIGR03663 family)
MICKCKITKPCLITVLILALAGVLRFLLLTMKAPHFDESTSGFFVMQIWQNGFYHYDPTNFHGPLFYYTLHLSELLLGFGIFSLRFSPVVFSIGCVWLALLHRRFFGRAAVWAALIIAVSPAMVFYARYAIHESLFIFCQLLFSYGFWLWVRERKNTAPFLMCGAVVADIATKETFFIFFITWWIAWVVTRIYEQLQPQYANSEEVAAAVGSECLSNSEAGRTWFYAVISSLAALLFVFSGFGNEAVGILNMFRAFGFWVHTGTANTGHEKSFFYWLKLLSVYEWPSLFALILTPVWLFVGTRPARVFALTGFGLWLAYSLIPYKTPWCIIGFIWPLAMSLGFAIEIALRNEALLRRHLKVPVRALVFTIFVFLLSVSLCKAIRLNFFHEHDFSEPYVYVQAPASLNEIHDILEARVRLRPEDRNMGIVILSREGWPFPWLLHPFHRVSFGQFNPQTLQLISEQTDFIVIDESNQVAAELALKKRYYRRPIQLRDSYPKGFAYYDFVKFQNLLPADSEILDPAANGGAK